jgi:hypothetical protein
LAVDTTPNSARRFALQTVSKRLPTSKLLFTHHREDAALMVLTVLSSPQFATTMPNSDAGNFNSAQVAA